MKLPEQAQEFSDDWIAAWNAHDLDRIVSHYAADVVFQSPRISVVTGEKSGLVKGKAALDAYWRKALAGAPDFHFTLERVYVSSNAVTVAYKNHRDQGAAETMIFNADGLIQEGVAAYA